MPVVKKHLVSITEFENPIPGIFTITFISEGKEFKFKPGQFLHLTLDEYDPSKGWPESRCFSMQTSPDEKFIKLTFAVKGKYTSRLINELKPGKKIWVKLPYGDLFTQDHSLNNCVFIAGGTGITPFLSLFNDDSFKEYNDPKIYFGAKSKKYNLYKSELNIAGSINSTLKIKISYEDTEGMLNIENIFNENGDTAVYFISGPPVMISNFKKYLLSKNVTAECIKTDEWE